MDIQNSEMSAVDELLYTIEMFEQACFFPTEKFIGELKVIASKLKEEAQAIPEGFVSIEDGLPMDGQDVIAFDAIKHCVFKDGEFLQGYFESDTGYEYEEPVQVTHWMAIEAQEQSHD